MTEMAEPVIEYLYPTRIWVGPACHNCGYWAEIPQRYQMALSCDADLDLMKRFNKTYQAKLQIRSRPDKTYQMDIVQSKHLTKTYQAGLKVRKAKGLPFFGHVYLQKFFDEELPMDIILQLHQGALYQASLKVRYPFQAVYFTDILMKRVPETPYGMNIVIRQSYFDQMMRDLEINTPQYWDITAPLLCRRRLGDLGETGETT